MSPSGVTVVGDMVLVGSILTKGAADMALFAVERSTVPFNTFAIIGYSPLSVKLWLKVIKVTVVEVVSGDSVSGVIPLLKIAPEGLLISYSMVRVAWVLDLLLKESAKDTVSVAPMWVDIGAITRIASDMAILASMVNVDCSSSMMIPVF